MLRLHIIQAKCGDCLILEFGTQSHRRYILIDGGPDTIYESHLRNELQEIGKGGGKLDLVVLSHVDKDHITGLMDLMADLRQQRAGDATETIAIDALWHNAFSQTIGSSNDIEARLRIFLANASSASNRMTMTSVAIEGIGEGNQLRLAAAALGIPINPGFSHDIVCLDEAPEPIALGNLSLQVVGPTKKNLEELKKEWLDWLDKHENSLSLPNPSLAAMIDQSIPNLSSIMFLAEADGVKILLTGDGRGDHLLEGLKGANLLNSKGVLHVDVLKVPHHGSDRNVTEKFFKKVTADNYVISANGKDGNPDLQTLKWIVVAAKEQGRAIEIYATNETSSTKKLVKECDPKKFGYRLTEIKKRSHSMILEMAS